MKQVLSPSRPLMVMDLSSSSVRELNITLVLRPPCDRSFVPQLARTRSGIALAFVDHTPFITNSPVISLKHSKCRVCSPYQVHYLYKSKEGGYPKLVSSPNTEQFVIDANLIVCLAKLLSYYVTRALPSLLMSTLL